MRVSTDESRNSRADLTELAKPQERVDVLADAFPERTKPDAIRAKSEASSERN